MKFWIGASILVTLAFAGTAACGWLSSSKSEASAAVCGCKDGKCETCKGAKCECKQCAGRADCRCPK